LTSNLSKKTKKKAQQQVFLHLPYHPRDITRNNIQKIYKHTCETEDNLGESFKKMKNANGGGTMKIEKLTVAYSRGKNLRDTLCNTMLSKTNKQKVS
jgi:hypothetical protein